VIPKGSYIFPLKPGTKEPSISGGHLSAILAPEEGRPRGNYGIRLDGQYIVVDIDCEHPDRESFEASLPPTWAQRTANREARAIHYLYTVPPGYIGSGKRVWLGNDGKRFADIKAKGYIVGPGSVVNSNEYTQATDSEPMPAPEWLLDFCRSIPSEDQNIVSTQYDGIPNGDHDSFLSTLTYWASHRWGLSEEANKVLLREGPLAVLQGTDPTHPYLETDIDRIARSGASKGQERPLELIEESWITANQLPEDQPITRWHLYNFIPQHELVLQYGTGGIGKSTWVAWLVGQVLKKGLRVGFCASEEPFVRFANRVRLGMVNFEDKLFDNLYDIGNTWKFPRDEEKLKSDLETCPLDFIYFDSIYDQFDHGQKGMSSLAEKARPCLTPLIHIAQEMKVTILGTFHENKSGDFNGPKDMENIPRVMLHATSKDDRLKLQVKKTNFTKPEYGIQVIGSYILETSRSGKPVLEENEEGEIVQKNIYVVTGYEKVSKTEETEYELPPEKIDRNEKVLELIDKGVSIRDIEKELGVPRSTVSDIKNKFRN